MKKIYRTFTMALSLLAIVGCSDEELVENTVPEVGQPKEIYLTASISDVNTRAAYSENANGNLKVEWETGDYLLVYPNHEVTDVVDTHSEAGYKFVLEEYLDGEHTRARFKYSGKTLKYVVNANGTATGLITNYKDGTHEDLADMTIKVYEDVEETATFPDYTTEGWHAMIKWENKKFKASECQPENGSTAHLQYHDVMKGEITKANFEYDGSNQTVEGIRLTHPKTIAMKLTMDQFCYDIHRGSHVGFHGLDEQTGEYKVLAGVYLQEKTEHYDFGAAGEIEYADYLPINTPRDNVMPTENQEVVDYPITGFKAGQTYSTDKFPGVHLNRENKIEPLVVYMMIDVAEINKYKSFAVTVTDSWSQDLYTWRVSLNATNLFSAGKYYPLNLTRFTCHQGIYTDSDIIVSIKDLGQASYESDGDYYRWADIEKSVPTWTDDDYKNSKSYTNDNNETKSWYEWLKLALQAEQNATGNLSAQLKAREDYISENLKFLEIDQREKFQYKSNNYKTIGFRNDYDAAEAKMGKMWRIPSITNMLNINGGISNNGYKKENDVQIEYVIQETTKTKHKLYFKNVGRILTGETNPKKDLNLMYQTRNIANNLNTEGSEIKSIYYYISIKTNSDTDKPIGYGIGNGYMRTAMPIRPIAKRLHTSSYNPGETGSQSDFIEGQPDE